MIWRKILFKPLSLLIVCGSLAFAQSFSPKQPIDFSAITTKPMQIGTILPATCAVGDQFFKSNATPGQNLYACTATNTWTQQAGGSSSSGQLFENRTSINNAASPYTILSTDSYFNCDATGGIVIANLPAATGTGRELTIKNTSGTNTCKFVRNGSDTIDGGTEVGTSDQNAVIKIIDRATGIWDRLHTQSLVGGVSGTTGNNVVDKIKAVTISATPPTTGQVLTATSATAANWQTLGTGGTVTSIGIITVPSWLTVTGSPVTTSGNITIDAAAAQTASRVVATPTTSGAVGLRQLDTTYISASALSGNGTKFATTTGALTNTHCVAIDANGNFIDAGSACGSGGGLGDPGSNGPVVRTALNTTAVATCSDIYKPGCVVAQGDQAPNTAYTDAQNTFSDPGNQYFGKYDVVCDATDASLTADNVLVKKASTGKCMIMTTTDTDITTGFWGVLVSGHGTTNGKVRRLGIASSISSTGTINTGDWIFVSTTTNGYIQGSASRPAAGTLVIGRANGPGPNPPVDLLIDPNSASVGSVGTDIHARVTMTADATIATNTDTPVAFDSDIEDVGGVHDTVTNNTRLTVPASQGGLYFGACQASFFEVFGMSTLADVTIKKNGTTELAHDVSAVFSAGFPVHSTSGVFTLSAGDYIECFVKQQDSTSHSLDHTRTFGMLTKLNVGGGGSGTPGGSDTQVQYNNAGTFAGSADFTINNGAHKLAGGTSSALDMSAAPATTGLKVPTTAGAAPTADGQIAVDSTAHTLKHGSNGSSKTVMDTDTAVQTSQLPTSAVDGSIGYCADAGASDSYACTLSPAPGSYVTGARYRFKANTANTGAATINFNSLGAKTIKKAAGGITTDLSDNDIRVGQLVDVVYDGTNMQMQSTLGNAAVGGSGYSTVQGNGTSATQRATVNFVGGPVIVSDVGGTTTQVSIEDPISTFYLKDNFGCGAYTSGSVGCLGWFLSASGFAAQPANSIAGSPGLLTLTTSGTINSVVSISPVATSHAFATSETFQIRTKIASIAGTSPASNTTIRIGLSDATTGTVDPPANGMYLEHLAADTNWFCVVRASSTDNRVDTGVAFAATATAVQIRRVDSTHIGCKVASSLGGLSGATEASNSGTEPTGDTVPYIMIKNTAAENKLLNLNFWDFLITGLSR